MEISAIVILIAVPSKKEYSIYIRCSILKGRIEIEA